MRGSGLAAIVVDLTVLSTPAVAAEAAWDVPLAPRAGWAVKPTPHDFEGLLSRLRDAVKAEGLAVVTEAGPTGAARARGIEIPGNRVLGVFNNVFAVRILEQSVAAMIEAPVRFYVTENPDGTATLAYKLPSQVFAPYADDGGQPLVDAAAELDSHFAAIAARAAAP
ncbi:DUF302 domain-containing protein [Limibaculum sp. FT325]|uniref:DUF302 domain-containing protein n=1 Tax=Thermohalobaculum sediminis TaxID=2939436 RepID=UPI0020C0F5C2|nr:DUF302 domain-containing protein [Limibaculum sediminis]MCL5779164.1 DUF302 domain-containing protein [Limibaculum sediminis]